MSLMWSTERFAPKELVSFKAMHAINISLLLRSETMVEVNLDENSCFGSPNLSYRTHRFS
jgi:hypothetical protein